MQVPAQDPAELFDRLVEQAVPGRRGLDAWRSLLHAHATLMRKLDNDLSRETGLSLADFDVLAKLAIAGGRLRMTQLAERVLISRSGMTRRVSRLVEEGLLRRTRLEDDARAVVVELTEAGMARLEETVPVHARGVAESFVDQLSAQELGVLKTALDKVIADCSFG